MSHIVLRFPCAASVRRTGAQAHLNGRQVRKVSYHEGRLINLVVSRSFATRLSLGGGWQDRHVADVGQSSSRVASPQNGYEAG